MPFDHERLERIKLRKETLDRVVAMLVRLAKVLQQG